MLDESLNAWLLEVNANPSLNVYTDKELPNGDIEQTLSELDKFVKTALISDTIKVVTTPNDQIKTLQELQKSNLDPSDYCRYDGRHSCKLYHNVL